MKTIIVITIAYLKNKSKDKKTLELFSRHFIVAEDPPKIQQWIKEMNNQIIKTGGEPKSMNLYRIDEKILKDVI